MPAPPAIEGFSVAWADDFSGNADTLPKSSNWAIETPLINNNGEQQKYTSSTGNIFLNGSSQLCIVPLQDNKLWTSGRIHGIQSMACEPGKKMILASSFRTGQNLATEQQGIWPAFWTLGDSVNHGVPWPTCCEWDIFEWGNGKPQNQGTLHQTGVDGQHEQQSGFVDFDHGQYHTWAVQVDLTNADYSAQSLTWLLDGHAYFSVSGWGSTQAERECWERCAHQAFFPIMNVAVGGNFVGDPNDRTKSGVGSGLTLNWVAFYRSV